MPKEIILNTEQQKFVSLVSQGKSCCLVGAAGTGKTTAVKQAISSLLESKIIPNILQNTGNPNNIKLREGLPGIVGCAFTRRAVANLRNNFPTELHSHCFTIHALLEYAPVKYSIVNASGELIETIRFEPQRNKNNPLPKELQTIIIEESSMVDTELFSKLLDAIPTNHSIQLVFLGDLNQLTPVFGDPILGYKLLELPTIELTEVYRQALESPIIKLAHRILSGVQLFSGEVTEEWQIPEKLKILNWKPKTTEGTAELTAIAYLKKLYKENSYNPYEDMVILPFNKSFGTTNFSKGIAKFLDIENNIHPTEIVSGFVKVYFAVGNLVIYKNEEYTITEINTNGRYVGKIKPDTLHTFDRFGNVTGKVANSYLDKTDYTTYGKTADELINQIIMQSEEEVTDLASHIIKLKNSEDEEIIIDSRGQINTLELAYSTTCHRAQGLESNRVFIIIHKCHGILMNREWLYTAVTRAKNSLTILCEKDTFVSGINKQQIKGKTLEEKAIYFKGKQTAKQSLVIA